MAAVWTEPIAEKPASLAGVLLGMGNPLLDISADVPASLLEKYGLEANSAILADPEKHAPLYPELVSQYKAEFVAGGATQNAIRGAQWMLPKGSTVYIGSVGKDKYAEELRHAAESDGVVVKYYEDEAQTGTCAVLLTDGGRNRSLVANLSAANNYKLAHLESEEIWKGFVEKAKFYYIEGYFFTVSPESILKLAKHAAEAGKIFAQNLSAPFLPQFFTAPMDEASPYWDIIFGNEAEFEAWGVAHKYEDPKDLKKVALEVSKLPKVSKRDRMVVITQGGDPVIVAYKGEVKEYPIIKIDKEKILDTNGAGDAFVGGFLSRLVLGESVDRCVGAGNYCANCVIQRNGATYPPTAPEFK
ncbi:adenosine kinase b [Hyaloraphidium curvatum]|nr:adenosine kinase b [Hyaloraphidium curvatum]